MRKLKNNFIHSILFASTVFGTIGVSQAQESIVLGDPVAVIGNFWSGVNKDKECTGARCDLKKDKDISGAVCTKGRCFVVSDEARFLQEFYFVDGSISAGQRFYLMQTDEKLERAKDKSVREIDLEALAAHDGNIIAIGSHSHRRKRCKKQKTRRQIFKFSVDALKFGSRAPVSSNRIKLSKTFKSFPELEPYFNKPLQNNGLNVEGAAVHKQRLYLGLRAPYNLTDQYEGYVVSGPVADLDLEMLTNPVLHKLRFKFKRTGIRAMEPFEDGIIVLAGEAGAKAGKEDGCDTASPPSNGSYDLYFWKPETGAMQHIETIARSTDDDETKPEGILIDPNNVADAEKVSLIVFYDSEKNGAPRRLQIPRSKLR